MKPLGKWLPWVAVLGVMLCCTAALAQVNHRPIEDFTNAQVNIMGWVNGNNPLFFGVIDFGGVINRYLADPKNNCKPTDLGTTFSGDITEKALPDGTTQVSIVLHGKNAFMRADLLLDFTHVLGYTRSEVCAGATPVLGEFMLTLKFINNAGLGGPLPDLWQLGKESGQVLQASLVNGTAQGPLRFFFDVPAGTPGFMHVVQLLPYVRGKGVPGKDYFPAELVDVKALGK